MLLALVMALSLVACGEKKDDTNEGGDTATGSVYYLNFKPESDNAWKALAATYTEKTGVPVKILTAASGEYESTLVSEMDKEDAPTLFQCNEGGVATWGEFCYDLSSSDVYNQLTSKDYALKNADGEVISIGYCLETYGIIVNKALLKEAGYENGEGLPELNIYTSVGFYPKTKEYYEYIAACLQAVGINCKVVPLDTSSWGDVLYEETPCYMIDCGWQPSGIEPELKLNSWYAAGRISHYEPTAELQDIMDRFATETDPDKRKQILQDEYLPALAEEMPDIPIIKSMTIFGVRSNVKGLEYTSGADSVSYTHLTLPTT